jgi:hypothetical protein
MSIPPALVPAAFRSLHVVAAVLLVGGLAYARLALTSVDGDALRLSLARYRGLIIAAIVALVATGAYAIATGGGRSFNYHLLFGIKVLLALHVFAASLLGTRTRIDDPARRLRGLTGILISGLAVVVLGVVLRYV